MDFNLYTPYNSLMNEKILCQLPESDMSADSSLQLQELLEEPSHYHVILINDDYTPMDFVIEILMQFFNKNYNDAYDIMLEVHERNSGVAGTYTLEIAEEKRRQVAWSAEANEFPLTCVIESA